MNLTTVRSRLVAVCLVLPLAAACSTAGGNVAGVPSSSGPSSSVAERVETAPNTAFMLRDDAGRPIPNTHIMPSLASAPAFEPYAFARSRNLIWHHGDVQTKPAIYVVYWGFTTDPSGEATYLNAFFKAAGASTWLDTVVQYYQNGNVHVANLPNQLKGAWYDNTDPVPAHPNDKQVAAEAVKLAAHFNVYSADASYVVATPTKHNINGFPKGLCAYHSDTSAGGAQIAYTNLPYMSDGGQWCGANSVNSGTLGKLDGVTIVGGHELAETQTDPGSGGWWDARGYEIGDKCSWKNLKNTNFGSLGTFPTQPLWSNATSSCLQ
jgi:hypothetical protein